MVISLDADGHRTASHLKSGMSLAWFQRIAGVRDCRSAPARSLRVLTTPFRFVGLHPHQAFARGKTDFPHERPMVSNGDSFSNSPKDLVPSLRRFDVFDQVVKFGCSQLYWRKFTTTVAKQSYLPRHSQWFLRPQSDKSRDSF
jgi:hypothetical protein